MTAASARVTGRAKAAEKVSDEQGAAQAVPTSSDDRLGDLREMLLGGSPQQLAELRAALGTLPADAFAPIDDGQERRGFPVVSDLLVDGELCTPANGRLARLTEAQFTHLRSTDTVTGEWDDGVQQDG